MSLGTVDAILPLGGAPRMGMPRRSRSLSGASLAGTVDDFVIDLDNDALKGLWTLTFGCAIQKLRPGIRTRSHRHTTSSVYYVVRGFGYSIIDGKRFNWTEGDYFALPHRVWHEHANASSSEPAVLFSLADEPAFETLVYRREEHWEQNGSFRQPDV